MKASGGTITISEGGAIHFRIGAARTLVFQQDELLSIKFRANRQLPLGTPLALPADEVMSSEVLSTMRGRGADSPTSTPDAPADALAIAAKRVALLSELREIAQKNELQLTYGLSYSAVSDGLARERNLAASVQATLGVGNGLSLSTTLRGAHTAIRSFIGENESDDFGRRSSASGWSPVQVGFHWRIPSLSSSSSSFSFYGGFTHPLRGNGVDTASGKPLRMDSMTRSVYAGVSATRSMDAVSVFGGAGLRSVESPSISGGPPNRGTGFELNGGYIFQVNDEFATVATLTYLYSKTQSAGRLRSTNDRLVANFGATYRLARDWYVRPTVEWGLLDSRSATVSVKLTQAGIKLW